MQLDTIKRKVFRTKRPFLSVTLQATSQDYGDEQTQVTATAEMHNPSKAVAHVENIEWTCHGVAPYATDIIEKKVKEYFNQPDGRSRIETEPGEFPWDLLERITHSDSQRALNPGETQTDTAAFIIPRFWNTVQIRIAIPKAQDRKQRWAAVVTHDIRITGQNDRAAHRPVNREPSRLPAQQ